jgi:glycosyltransferase involved in cell wall biosynthesis
VSAGRGLGIGVDGRELQGRPTGVGRYLRSLLRSWPAADDRLVVYVSGAAPDDPVLADPRIVVRPVGDQRTRGLAFLARALPRASEADALDVFFAPAYVCPPRLRVPRVTTVHDLSFFSLPSDFTAPDAARRRWQVGLSVAASRLLIAPSEFTAREILGHFPAAAGRVARIPEGPDLDLPPAPAREAARGRLGVRGPLLLSVGSILNRRCLPTLLRAVARLKPRWQGLRLDVVGENRTHPRLDLPALAKRLGLEAVVCLPGFVSDRELAERYAAADVAVFLSEYEGFGLPALEAMARGVPVVVSDRPALSEIYAGAALVVDPHDEAAVAGALDRLLRDRALAEDQRARGRALAARHSWAEAARATRAALEEALA